MTTSWTAPKTDQLNADDLIAGPRVIRIRKIVVKESGEQRCHIFFDGDDNKPWKPCKTMGRIMEQAWTTDPQKWVGKFVKVFRDPEAMYGGVKQGGIRIEALSDISDDFTTSVTVSRGVRKPYKVMRLVIKSEAAAPRVEMSEAETFEAGVAAAATGLGLYNGWCNQLTPAEKVFAKKHHADWKKKAIDVDTAAAGMNTTAVE